MNEDRWNELILEELKGIKSEFISMRTDITSIRKDMLTSANTCGQKHTKLADTFVHGITFWKVTGILLFLISGSYAYATVIYKLLVNVV